jgi:Tol biopolymer transport system component
MALDSGTRLGPYEILAALGAGGMGEVYRARDTRLDRLVAVKVLPGDAASPQALERFTREAKAIAALNHPGICAIYDVGTSPVPFLVMELLDGETLHQRLTRGPMDATGVVDTGLALADALSAAHAKGILHRDLKPANIVLTPRGPKILDFGLARATESVAPVESGATAFETLAAQSPLTDVGVAVGTVSYMSPEQLRGEPLDERTDLFSLGLVLYEMATGRRAFSGATSAVVTAAILHEQPAAPRQIRPELPARLEQAFLTLLEKDRDVRTQTASELRAELTRMRRELSSANVERPLQTARSAGTPTVAPPPASSSDAQVIAGVMRRHRGAVFAAAAMSLLFVAAGAYVATRPGATNIAREAGTRPSLADLQVEQLTTSGTAGYPAVSPDGNYVAYVETGPNGESLRVRQVATAGNVEILPPEPGVRLVAPAVTPDGTFVDYVKRIGERYELWQIPFLGGTPRQLLTEVGTGVAFSTDGRQMAFVRGDGAGKTEVVVAAADGTGARVLATRQAPNGAFLTIPGTGGLGWYAPAWASDGLTLAVLGGRAGFTGQVAFIDAKTGSERVVEIGPPLPAISVAWLDEGTLILSLLDKSSAPLQLWLLSYPQGEFSRLTNDPNQYVGLSVTADRSRLVTARSEASFSIWTSDAGAAKWTQVVPTTPQKGPIGFDVAWLGDDLIFPSMASGSWTLERWRASTRTTETIAGAGGLPQVSRDGSIVYFDYDTGELLKMDASGRNRTRLARGSAGLRLTSDGKQLTFIETASGTPTVRIRSIDDTGETRVITTDRVRPGYAQVSPDGQRIAYSSFDDQNRNATMVCDFPACASKRLLPINADSWTGDSQGLAYLDPRAPADVWVQPIDGSAARQITHFPADGQQIWGLSWSADGRLAVGRASIRNNIILFRGLKQAR